MRDSNVLGVPVETTVGLSPSSPQPSASGLSGTIPNALIDQSLRIACADDGVVHWQQQPFTVNLWNAATDAHVLVGISALPQYERCEASDAARGRISNWLAGNKDCAPGLVSASGILRGAEVVEAARLWPRVEAIDCASCYGTGVEHEDDGTEDGELNALECQSCGGSGVINSPADGEQFPDPMQWVELVGIAHFKHYTWIKLAKIVDMLLIEELRITHGSPNTMLRLEAANVPMVICLMPGMWTEGCYEPFYTHKTT